MKAKDTAVGQRFSVIYGGFGDGSKRIYKYERVDGEIKDERFIPVVITRAAHERSNGDFAFDMRGRTATFLDGEMPVEAP